MFLTHLMVLRMSYLKAVNLAWGSKSALFFSDLTWIKGKQCQGEEKHLITLELRCSPTSHHLMMNEFHIISKGHLSQLKQCEKSLNRGWSVEDGGEGVGGVDGTKVASEVMISTFFFKRSSACADVGWRFIGRCRYCVISWGGQWHSLAPTEVIYRRLGDSETCLCHSFRNMAQCCCFFLVVREISGISDHRRGQKTETNYSWTWTQ